MQNLLPMRLVFVGASTPTLDGGETATGLANTFVGVLKGLSDTADLLLSCEEAPAGVSMTAFTGVSSWPLLAISSEARLWCRLVRGGGRGNVEDCCTVCPSKTSDQSISVIPATAPLEPHIYEHMHTAD